MPTWMAPKLPPPANTKAVFAGLGWSDTDKASVAPGIAALARTHATVGSAYSSAGVRCTINVCEAVTVIPTRSRRTPDHTPRPVDQSDRVDAFRNN
jgi:hypothetical protein